MHSVPCAHLLEDALGGDVASGRCELARRIPEDCGACPAYVPGLTLEERTRCEIWTRVMGYHRPLSAFNPGKRSEHAERTPFEEPPTC
jgi:hypothetical protein